MAQDHFINMNAGVTQSDGTVDPDRKHGSTGTGDLTFGWDSAKFPNKRSLLDALRKIEFFINSNRGLTP